MVEPVGAMVCLSRTHFSMQSECLLAKETTCSGWWSQLERWCVFLERISLCNPNVCWRRRLLAADGGASWSDGVSFSNAFLYAIRMFVGEGDYLQRMVEPVGAMVCLSRTHFSMQSECLLAK